MGRAEDAYLLAGEAVHLEDENIGGTDNEVADGRLIFDQSQGMLQSLAGYQLATIYILAMKFDEKNGLRRPESSKSMCALTGWRSFLTWIL